MVHVVSEPRLAESYRTCRRLQRRHDPTYYCATRCLPRDVQPAVHALYGFVRGADQIVDGPAAPAARRRRAARRSTRGRPSSSAGWPRALRASRHRRAGRRRRRATGCRCTCCRATWTRCASTATSPCGSRSRAQLDDYMEGSAATVGRVIAPLLGAPGARGGGAAGRRLPADELHPRRAGRLGPRPRLPARAARGRPARRRRQRVAARAHRPGGRAAPASCSPRPRGARAGARDAPRRAHGPRRLRARARPRRGQRLRRARGAGAPAPVGGRARRRLGR